MATRTLLFALIALTLGQGCVAAPTSDKPVVDLGYGLWQASVNTTGQYYNFSNIRYAQPPVGNLRFACPEAPLTNRSVVNDGQDGRMCPQASPSWGTTRNLFYKTYLANTTNITSFQNNPLPGTVKVMPEGGADGRENEDCLFLDVIVPSGIYNNSTRKPKGGAPVLVWTFGGGFYEGDKTSQGDPAGMLLRSMKDPTSSPGVVYVTLNYRLGALGWLSGTRFAASGGVPNAGLHDQRFAFDWIQKNIHLFGGDPSRVTVMGESAGAAMNMHQITAYGDPLAIAPFQQAVLASPAFTANPYQWEQEKTYSDFLANANVTCLAELRKLTSAEVIAANEKSVFEAPYGATPFGPVVDGIIVPQLPTSLLAQGRRAMNVQNVFLGHNSDEGLLFTNPQVQNSTSFNEFLSSTLLPDATEIVLSHIENDLYPAQFDNKTVTGYNDTTSRLATLVADYFISSHITALAKSFGVNKTHAFLFTEGFGLHGEDTAYTFYNGPQKDVYGAGNINGTVAETLQSWIINFGVTGNPNGNGTAHIPVYGKNRAMGLLSNEGLGLDVADPATKERCDFWEQSLYY